MPNMKNDAITPFCQLEFFCTKKHRESIFVHNKSIDSFDLLYENVQEERESLCIVQEK